MGVSGFLYFGNASENDAAEDLFDAHQELVHVADARQNARSLWLVEVFWRWIAHGNRPVRESITSAPKRM